MSLDCPTCIEFNKKLAIRMAEIVAEGSTRLCTRCGKRRPEDDFKEDYRDTVRETTVCSDCRAAKKQKEAELRLETIPKGSSDGPQTLQDDLSETI